MTRWTSHTLRLGYALAAVFALGLPACGNQASESEIDPNGEGLAFDSEHPQTDFRPKEDQLPQYTVPDWVLDTKLVRPEIRVSLDGLSVHLFDREGDFSRVYPTGPGALGQNGKSVTPTGFFATSPSADNSWWNISERFAPEYFGGFPFIRLTAHNSRGQNTYGMHGPITYSCPDGGSSCRLRDRDWYLVHDYVSHGCMRMEAHDVVEVFYLLQGHESVPVTIQQEVEIDSRGEIVEVGAEAVDWPVGFSASDEIAYGELGERPNDWSPCTMPSDWPFRRYGC